MRTVMITGPTQGLGLQIATQLARLPNTRVVMAVRNMKKGEEVARLLGTKVTAVQLDLSTLGDVAKFANAWDTKLDGLVNNAGVRFSTSESFTAASFEETIAANHLAAFALTMVLEKRLLGGRVLFIGSGAHNPTHPPARMFGYRGAQFTSVQELATGISAVDDVSQRNRNRYATSKFLNMVTAAELARRNKPYRAFVPDPGLMPGTGLARTHNSVMRLLRKRAMPIVGLLLPDTSNPVRSAKAAVWILTEQMQPYPTGTIFSYNRKPSKGVWDKAVLDPKVGREVYEQSLQIVEGVLR